VYGTLGTPAAANIPGVRAGASTWTDASGNLWLFGGQGNDLWKYSPSSNEWTWIAGSDEITNPDPRGVSGTKGSSDPSNTPGGRQYALSWTDKNGNFWLFGGNGLDASGAAAESGDLNDLWEFNPSTSLWTWISGSNTYTCVPGPATCGVPGVYGTQGVPSPSNVPGARYAAQGWIDSAGDFWLFGGLGNDGSTPITDSSFGSLSDVWMFNPSTSEWTWMNGPNRLNQPAVYGTLGVPAAGNTPGQRTNPASWVDKNGHFWLFSGDSSNELWEYLPEINQWAWMNGTNTTNCASCSSTAKYGTLGIAAPGNTPGQRAGASSWTDNNGNLWLFGGFGFGADNTFGYSNELWEFFPATNQWAWMGGISVIPSDSDGQGGQPGVYGTQGIPNIGNIPGARQYSAGWTDLQGNFWLFGGTGHDANDNQGDLNDLWEYQPSTAPLPLAGTPVFNSAAGSYNTIQTVTIADAANGSVIYYTTDGTTPTTSSPVYSGPITVSSNETLEAIATASGCYPSDVAIASYTITSPDYPAPVISGLSPALLNALGGPFTLFVNGTGYTTSSTVYWGSTALATQALSGTQLAAQVPAILDGNPGTAAITVTNPTPGGGTSGTFLFEMDSASSYWVTPPQFNPSSATVSAGATATYPVTLPSLATNVSASCLNLPSGAACSYSASTHDVTVTTSGSTPARNYQITVVFTETVPLVGSAYVPLPFLLVPFLLLRKRLAARSIWLTLCTLFVIVIATYSTGCGGGSGGSGSTNSPPQTHQVTSSGTVVLIVH
jgi:N-acetylneuraminic acid mutarotase